MYADLALTNQALKDVIEKSLFNALREKGTSHLYNQQLSYK